MASVEVTDSGKANAKLALMDFAARRALMLFGQRVALRAVRIQTEKAPVTVATGQTRRTHTVRPPRVGIDSQGRYIMVQVGPRTKYAFWGIEYGRNPFKKMPPFKNIYNWVREKPFGRGLPERDAFALAKYVQKKVAEEGFPAQFVLNEALLAEHGAFTQIVRASVIAMLKG